MTNTTEIKGGLETEASASGSVFAQRLGATNTTATDELTVRGVSLTSIGSDTHCRQRTQKRKEDTPVPLSR